jgi:outer membrane receptor for monomeric catechols
MSDWRGHCATSGSPLRPFRTVAELTKPNNVASREDHLVNWDTGVVYKPPRSPASMRPHRIGSARSLTPQASSMAASPSGRRSWSQEKSIGTEIGTKWELFERRLWRPLPCSTPTGRTHARTPAPATMSPSPAICTAADTGAYRERGGELGVRATLQSGHDLRRHRRDGNRGD